MEFSANATYSRNVSAAQSLIDRVLGETISGGAAVNACAVQGALPSFVLWAFALPGKVHWSFVTMLPV